MCYSIIYFKMNAQTDCGSDFQNGKTVKEPEFSKLTYADAGIYMCEVSMTGLRKNQSFKLVVEGMCVHVCVCITITNKTITDYGVTKWDV